MKMRFFIACIFFYLPVALLSQYSGGDGNGFDTKIKANLVLTVAIDTLYSGGYNNGFSSVSASINLFVITDSLYTGGYGNGFSNGSALINLLGITDCLYSGGSGRGEGISTGLLNLYPCGITITWNGSISTMWSDAANWNCGAVPGPGSMVIIPAGLTRYPTIFSSAEIKGITIESGATVNIAPNINLKIK